MDGQRRGGGVEQSTWGRGMPDLLQARTIELVPENWSGDAGSSRAAGDSEPREDRIWPVSVPFGVSRQVLPEERGSFRDGLVDVLRHVVEVHVCATLDDHQLLGTADPAVQFGGHPQ